MAGNQYPGQNQPNQQGDKSNQQPQQRPAREDEQRGGKMQDK